MIADDVGVRVPSSRSRRVDPSMSVKRKVIVPTGRVIALI
jgi:hypothetical protein